MESTTIQATDVLKKSNGGTMHDCAKQWASRPADERVYTVDDLVARTQRAKDASGVIDKTPWGEIRVSSLGDNDLALIAPAAHADFSNYSLGQLCGLPVGDGSLAPQSFIEKLRGPIAAAALNDRLQRGVGRTAHAQLLVQDRGVHGTTLRAITTDAYERVWDADIALRVADLASRGTWQAAEAFRKAGASLRPKHAMDVPGRQHEPFPVGWVGDRNMFVALFDYEGSVTVEGTEYVRFLLLSNSEVGAGSLKVTFGLLDYVCCNFIMWGCRDVYEASLRHTKSIHDKWAALGQGLTRQLTAGQTETIVDGIKAARGYQLGETPEQVIAVTRAATDLPQVLVEDAYVRAEATSRYGSPRTAWGMLNGLTEASQYVTKHADKRAEIDAKAARLMGLLR